MNHARWWLLQKKISWYTSEMLFVIKLLFISFFVAFPFYVNKEKRNVLITEKNILALMPIYVRGEYMYIVCICFYRFFRLE
jgi:hypothetical protein